MEEDIKDLKELRRELGLHTDGNKIKQGIALEHLIKAYKELEEENKIIKGNYYTLSADIQMVTSELGFPEDTIIADEMVSMIKENYIPVSLVKEKIEKTKFYIPEYNGEFIAIEDLQELLEKR